MTGIRLVSFHLPIEQIQLRQVSSIPRQYALLKPQVICLNIVPKFVKEAGQVFDALLEDT